MADFNYADEIINLSLTGNLVRIELGAVSVQKAGKEGKAESKLQPAQTLVMPLDGFVRSFRLQEKLVQEMVKETNAKKAKAEGKA